MSDLHVRILMIYYVVVLCLGQNEKVTGPYYIPDWEMPRFSEGVWKGKGDVLVYQENLKATLFSSRSWRYVWRWQFLNRHFSDINSYVIIPGKEDAKEWVQQRKCKVGKTYESSRDNECWKDLDNQKLENWIESKTLVTTPPSMRPYMSTCSIYYSCDIHDVTFPIYISAKNYDPFISGPHGENINVAGDGTIQVERMEDSFLVFSSVRKLVNPQQFETECIYQGEDPLKEELLCNYYIEKSQVTVKFKEKQEATTFNNFVLYRPKIILKSVPKLRNDADAATKGDLKELENKLTLVMKDVMFMNHQLQQELSNVKHILKNLVLSTAKIDDNLIGKIARVPVKTKWLNDEVFLLSSSVETLIHNLRMPENSTCLGSYFYENGRWVIKQRSDDQCSKWNSTTPLKIMDDMLKSPLEILEAPEYRNASSGYSGWTFLDNGRVSLDWLDKGLKYQDGSNGFDFNLSGLNITQILMMIAYIIIAVIAITLISTVVKAVKS